MILTKIACEPGGTVLPQAAEIEAGLRTTRPLRQLLTQKRLRPNDAILFTLANADPLAKDHEVAALD